MIGTALACLVATTSFASASCRRTHDGGVPVRTSLYPQRVPLKTGSLAVGRPHSLYYEVHGKADGAPALFLHGGPGAGCFRRHAGFFDPDHYKIVLFDQRGCGRSTPKGELTDNETPFLVEDCEALRRHLGIERWSVVLGGSWGVTLALALAIAHPTRVRALVLRAVCLMRAREIEWLFGARGGAARCAPEGWKRFADAAPFDAREEDKGEVLLRYARAFAGHATDPATSSKAASSWMDWESAITALGASLTACPTPGGRKLPSGVAPPACWAWDPERQRWELRDAAGMPSELTIACDVADNNGSSSSSSSALSDACEALSISDMEVRETLVEGWTDRVVGAVNAKRKPRPLAPPSPQSQPPKPPPPPPPAALKPAAPGATAGWVPAQAILTSHYSAAAGFLRDAELLTGVDALRGKVLCIAVQGANDMICPPYTAFELHEAWPEMTLRVVPRSGHSMYDGGLLSEVIRATDELKLAEQREAAAKQPQPRTGTIKPRRLPRRRKPAQMSAAAPQYSLGASSLAASAAASLHERAIHVELGFLSGSVLSRAREAAHELIESYGTQAGLGAAQAIDAVIRTTDYVDLLAASTPLPRDLFPVVEAIEALRESLARETGRPLVEDCELQLLRYPVGGHYSRHVDDSGVANRDGSVGALHHSISALLRYARVRRGGALRRSISVLIYLTPEGWSTETDGGALRVHMGEDFDVSPDAGSLVLFDSARVPHSVLPTRRERLVIAGWLMEEW